MVASDTLAMPSLYEAAVDVAVGGGVDPEKAGQESMIVGAALGYATTIMASLRKQAPGPFKVKSA